MSLQYSNNVSVKDFRSIRGSIKKPPKNSGRFSFYYTSPSDNIPLPVITQGNPHAIEFFNWGLIPSWIKSEQEALAFRTRTLNARCETIFKLPAYRGYIKRKRCLIPATGFIEWHLKLGSKYPLLVTVKEAEHSNQPRSFCFGGVYSNWTDEESGELINTFSMITTPANELLSFIHNSNKRMPMILSLADEINWLNPALSDNEIVALMKPYPQELVQAHTIGRRFIWKDAEPNEKATLTPYEYKNLEPYWGFE